MKLSPLTVIIIGISISIIALSYALFYHYLPNTQTQEQWETYRNALIVEANKYDKAVERVETAQRLVNERATSWRSVVATRTPVKSVTAGGINVEVNGWQLAVDSLKFRNNVQRALNAQLKRGGVRVISGPSIPQPDQSGATILASYYNYPAIAFPVVIFDLGPVTVQGTYEQITRNVRAWSSMPRYLAVADGLTISGTSPNLTGTYNLTLVGFVRAKAVFPPVPEGVAATNATGGGGRGGVPGPGSVR
jgi:hypothetical protein